MMPTEAALSCSTVKYRADRAAGVWAGRPCASHPHPHHSNSSPVIDAALLQDDVPCTQVIAWRVDDEGQLWPLTFRHTGPHIDLGQHVEGSSAVEVAAVLQVHPRSVQRWASQGRFAAVRAGRTYRIPRAEVLRWIVATSTLTTDTTQSAVATRIREDDVVRPRWWYDRRAGSRTAPRRSPATSAL